MADDYFIDEEGNVRTKFEKSSFEPVPAGEYDMIIQNIEIREGKESGKPYFNIEFRITDPDPDIDNKPVFENISPSAAWRVSQLLEAVYGPQDAEEGDELEFNIFDMFGAQVRARVGLEERLSGDGMTNNITRLLPSEESTPKKTTAKKKTTTRKRTSAKK